MSEHDETKQPGGAAPRRRRRSRRRSSRPSGAASSNHTLKQHASGESAADQDSRGSSGEQKTGANQSGEHKGRPAAGEGDGQRSRRRPNRRRRGRGGSRRQSGEAQQAHKSQSSQQSDTAAVGSAGSTSRSTSAKTSSASDSTSGSEQPRKKSNRSRRRRGGGPQGQNRRQQRNRGRSQPQRPSRQRMQTSDETSAGGLVVSGMAEAVRADGSVDLNRIYVALIGRLDRRGRLLWSMPKGHVEPGEDQCATAEREVWEETGIECEVFADLGTIDYWFVSEGTRIHKTVHHHLLRFVDGDLNDEDPEVTEVSWIPVSALLEKLAYADERKLARRAHDLLPDLARAEKEAGRATPR